MDQFGCSHEHLDESDRLQLRNVHEVDETRAVMRDLVRGMVDGRTVLGSQQLKTGSCRDGVEV